MKGCVKLFAGTKLAGDQMASLARFDKDERDFRSGARRFPAASWDREIHKATYDLDLGTIGIDEAKSIIGEALRKRAAFLARLKNRR